MTAESSDSCIAIDFPIFRRAKSAINRGPAPFGFRISLGCGHAICTRSYLNDISHYPHSVCDKIATVGIKLVYQAEEHIGM